MLQNEYSLATIGFVRSENEPAKTWPNIIKTLPNLLNRSQRAGDALGLEGFAGGLRFSLRLRAGAGPLGPRRRCAATAA